MRIRCQATNENNYCNMSISVQVNTSFFITTPTQDCSPVLPLILVKVRYSFELLVSCCDSLSHLFPTQLLDNERQQEFQLLLDSCGSFMEALLTDMSPQNSLFLWNFLDVLFTNQSSMLCGKCLNFKGA